MTPHTLLLIVGLFVSSVVTQTQIPTIVYKNATTISIGMSVFNNTPFPADKYHGGAWLNGTEMFMDYLMAKANGTVKVRGQNLTLTLNILDNQSNRTIDTNNLDEFCNDDNVVAVIGSVDTVYCLPGNNFFTNVSRCPNQKVHVTGCALAQQTARNAFSVATNANYSVPAFFPYFRIAGVTKVAMLIANHPYPRNLAIGVRLFAPQNGVNIVYEGYLNNTFTSGDVENCTAEVQRAIDAGAQGLLLFAFEQCVMPIMFYLKEIQFSFDIILVSPERDYSPSGAQAGTALPIDVSNYLTVVTKGHPDAKFSDGWIANYTEFYSEYQTKYGIPPPFFAPYYYTAVQMVYQALSGLSDTVDTCVSDPSVLFTSAELADGIAKLSYTSLVGQIVFDSQRRSLSTELLYQLYNGTTHVVAPPTTQFRDLYIAPPWAQRNYNPSYSQVEIGFFVVIGVLALISVALIIVVFALRETSMISASMPTFLLAMLVGSLLVYGGVFIWTYHALTTTICHLRVWLIALGFVLIYGCMLTKNFRVWFLWYSAAKVENVIITNAQLVIVMVISVAIMSVLLAIYSGAGNVQATMEVVDPLRQAFNIERCTENTTGTVMFYLMFILGIISLLVGLLFSFLTRKVTFLAFNESKLILFSVYNIFFFSVLAFIVLHLRVSPEVQYILRSLCILLASFVTILIVFGTKLWYLAHDKTGASKIRKGTSSTVNTSKATSRVLDTDE